jgi:hypothetical protein
MCDLKNCFNITQITVWEKRGEVLKEKKRGEGRRQKRNNTQLNFRDLSSSGLMWITRA